MAGRDPRPHDAGADDGRAVPQSRIGRRRSISMRAVITGRAVVESLVAPVSLTQPEHPDELPRDIRLRESGKGGGFDRASLVRGRVATGENGLEDGQRRGIVAAAAAEDHGCRHRLQKVPFLCDQRHRPGHLPPPLDVALLRGSDLRQPTGRDVRLVRRHAGIYQSQSCRGGAVDVFARRRQFDRGGRADQTGEANSASPRREQTQLHLGAPEACLRRVGGDPQVAGEGEFETAAEADAVDDRHARPRLGRKPREDRAARRAQSLDLHRGHAVQSLEAGDIGPGKKRALPRRSEHDRRRRRSGVHAVERPRQLGYGFRREHILGVVGYKKRDHDPTIVPPFERERAEGACWIGC